MTYDEWRLSGPDEHPEPEMTECSQCDGEGWVWGHEMDDPPDVPQPDDTRYTCDICGGSGEVPVDADEPDGDYQYERRRDAAIDRG